MHGLPKLIRHSKTGYSFDMSVPALCTCSSLGLVSLLQTPRIGISSYNCNAAAHRAAATFHARHHAQDLDTSATTAARMTAAGTLLLFHS